MKTYSSFVCIMTKKNENAERTFSGFHFRDSEILSVEKLNGGNPSVWEINIISDSTSPLAEFKKNLLSKVDAFCTKNKMSIYDADVMEEGGF